MSEGESLRVMIKSMMAGKGDIRAVAESLHVETTATGQKRDNWE